MSSIIHGTDKCVFIQSNERHKTAPCGAVVCESQATLRGLLLPKQVARQQSNAVAQDRERNFLLEEDSYADANQGADDGILVPPV